MLIRTSALISQQPGHISLVWKTQQDTSTSASKRVYSYTDILTLFILIQNTPEIPLSVISAHVNVNLTSDREQAAPPAARDLFLRRHSELC